ncbi:MAG: 4Fe-4S binding protein [Candidatus Methanoperedens sp.]
MCEMCIKHGSGKKWYLNLQNYSNELLEDPDRIKYVEKYVSSFEKLMGIDVPRAFKYTKFPVLGTVVKHILFDNVKKYHFGQVVPLEDAIQILKIADPIGIVPCVCRRALLGVEDKCCFIFGMLPLQIFDKYPDFTRDKCETISQEKAISLVEDRYQKGYVQSVWTFKTPYIGALCQCEFNTCGGMRYMHFTGINELYRKSEYVAFIDTESCTGCKKCISMCQFGAMSYSMTLKRAFIEPGKCFGCGVCRTACKNNSIYLFPRNNLIQVDTI